MAFRGAGAGPCGRLAWGARHAGDLASRRAACRHGRVDRRGIVIGLRDGLARVLQIDPGPVTPVFRVIHQAGDAFMVAELG